MTVYVDPLFYWPGPVSPAARGYGREWCHLATDAIDLGELHHYLVPHYDLTPGARAGAVEETATGLVRACRRTGLTGVGHLARGRCDLRVDRGTDWGNPFVVGEGYTREGAVEAHFRYVLGRPDLMARLGELRGKTLG